MAVIQQPRTVNLALQGGGAHGAFTWGVLDRLLDEPKLTIDGISGTSAGAMNAAMVKTGMLQGGREQARARLDAFWGALRRQAAPNANPLADWIGLFSPEIGRLTADLARLPADKARDTISRSLSPYDWNPSNFNPLRDLLDDLIDFDCVCSADPPHLFISATNVRTGRIKIFKGHQITVDAILASACLPDLFQAVEIEGEAYWDGGYMGNPALFPLFYDTNTPDVIIVHVNPIERPDIPRSAAEIQNRINEVSFNSSLLRELRAIGFVRRLIREGKLNPGEMMNVLVHSIRDDATMAGLSITSKIAPEPDLFERLKTAGQTAADAFLSAHWQALGRNATSPLLDQLD